MLKTLKGKYFSTDLKLRNRNWIRKKDRTNYGQDKKHGKSRKWFRKSQRSRRSKREERKKKKESNSNKELDSITCSTCKTVFTDHKSKIICCDRCEIWFCVSCANVTDACYKFLSSEDAIDITWYCKACKLLAKKAKTEDRNIKQKCMEYSNELKQKMESIAIIQRKVNVTEL